MSEPNKIIFECVNEALSKFDFVDKNTFQRTLHENYGAKDDEFADKFEIVHAALIAFYGINHYKIERAIIQILNERVKKGIYARSEEIKAFSCMVTVFMQETQKNLERNKEAAGYAKHLETKVKEANEKLKASERMAAIGETAAMVGHDIRNPLQAIVGELYLQKEDVESLPDVPEKASLRESVKNIEECVFYINKIVADLQDFAKPLKAANKEEVDINKVINEVLSMIPIPSKLQVRIYVEEGVSVVFANYQMLKRAMTNLVMNAVQAMPEGGDLIITAKRVGDFAEVAVQDNGKGIPDEVKAKLFKPLFTTKPKGQGLGLAVVKRLVETMGGKVGFESENGHGAKFYIHLPIKPKR